MRIAVSKSIQCIEGRFYLLLCVITIFFSMVSFFALNRSLWLDESYTMQIINSDTFYEELVSVDHPPLYFVLLKTWASISSDLSFLRILSVIFYALTVLTMGCWLRTYNFYSGLAGAVFIASFPIVLRYSVELRGYSLLLFLTTFVLYATRLISQSRSSAIGPYFLYVVGGALLLSTHTVGIFILFSSCFYFLIVQEKIVNKKTLKYFIATIVSVALYLPVYCIFVFQTSLDKDAASWWMPYPDIDRVLSTLYKVFGLEQGMLVFTLVLLFFGILFSSKKRESLGLITPVVIYCSLLLLVSYVYLPIFWYRIVMPLLVPFSAALCVSYGSSRLMAAKWGFFICVCFFCFFNLFNWLAVEGKKPIEQWDAVVNAISGHYSENDIVVLYLDKIEYIFKYYAPKYMDIRVVRHGDDYEKMFNQISSGKNDAKIFIVFRNCLFFKKNATVLEKINAQFMSTRGNPEISSFGIIKLLEYDRIQ